MKKLTVILCLILQVHSDKSLSQMPSFGGGNTSVPTHFIDGQPQADASDKNFLLEELQFLLNSRSAGRTTLGYSANKRPIEAWYFPGSSEERALVIAGVHGSELSSVEVAKNLIRSLKTGELPYYSVVIIPVLFPDNAIKAKVADQVGVTNKGRYTDAHHADPNRQMPALGRSFDITDAHDHAGRMIEKENQLLLQLIQEYKPSRIVNLHAIRDEKKAGIYADPRTDCKGVALGFSSDSSLSVMMAKYISTKGGKVPGNRLDTEPTALYYCDPVPADFGNLQKRNLHGSPLPGNRGYGVSLGGWASTAVCDGRNDRDAIRLLTVEFPGYRSPEFYDSTAARVECILNISLYAKAIRNIFLGNNFAEVDSYNGFASSK